MFLCSAFQTSLQLHQQEVREKISAAVERSDSFLGALTSAHLTPTAKHATLHAAATNINRKMGASPQKPAGTLPGGVAAAPAIDVSNVNRKMTGIPERNNSFPPSFIQLTQVRMV